MATLVSPGVAVSVTDESFFAGAGAGTVPVIVIATGQDKTLADATTAAYTTSATAGKLYLITSQRDLLTSYGEPTFKVSSGTAVHGHETNEHGLLAAYSFLGISNRAYVLRANINTTELEATATEPTGPPNDGQVWLDTTSTAWGIFEADSDGSWVSKTPTILTAAEVSGTDASAVPNDSIATVTALPVDSYAIVTVDSAGTTLAGWRYYKKTAAATWTEVIEGSLQALGGNYAATEVYVYPHTNVPTGNRYDIWVKTTSANAGMSVAIKQYSSTTAGWTTLTTPVLNTDAQANSPGRFGVGTQAYGTAVIAAGDIASITVDDAGTGYSSGNLPTVTLTGATNRTATATVDSSGKITALTVGGTADSGLAQGDITVSITGGAIPAAGSIYVKNSILAIDGPEMIVKTADGAGTWAAITPGTATGNLQSSPTALTGTTTNGTLWYDSTLLTTSFDAYSKATGMWVPKAVSAIGTATPTAPSNGDLWIDTTTAPALVFKIYNSGTSAWVSHDSADQTTPSGVVFGDITETAGDTSNGATGATLLTGAPNPALYPAGMLAVNLCRSTYNVRKYDSALTTTWKWRSESGTAADGSACFGRFAQRKVIIIAMQAALMSDDLRAESLSFNLIASPGYTECADEMYTLAGDRKDTAFVVVDTPLRLANTGTGVSTWIDGTAAVENGEDGLVSPKNDKMAVWYPGGALTTNTDGYTVAQPISHVVLRQLAYNDQVAYPWFAPAGIARGSVLNATNIGYLDAESEFTPVALSAGMRDTLYNKKVNPVANFPGEGIVLWGQKTLYGASSALDRINVSRLVIHMRERLDRIVRPFIFEPNDTLTRANVKDMIERFIGDIQAKRGIYDFAVVCDTSNNTPARIDKNELWIDIAIEPSKSAEFIYIPVRILNTGSLAGTS
jgi:hypothetical protein